MPVTRFTFPIGLALLDDENCLPANWTEWRPCDQEIRLYITLENVHMIRTAEQLKHALMHNRQLQKHLQHLNARIDAVTFYDMPGDSEIEKRSALEALRKTTDSRLLTLVYPRYLPQPHPRNFSSTWSLRLAGAQHDVVLTATCPIIWLDVDGVINSALKQEDAFRAMFPDAKQTRCAAFENHHILYSPTVIAKINEWSHRAEIRWLTSWGTTARYHLAPLLGLLDFTVCTFSKSNATCKASHNEVDYLRPLVWIDDEKTNPCVQDLFSDTLLVKPRYFLSIENMAQVDDFLARSRSRR